MTRTKKRWPRRKKSDARSQKTKTMRGGCNDPRDRRGGDGAASNCRRPLAVHSLLAAGSGSAARALVERFDIEPCSDFSSKWYQMIKLYRARSMLYRRQILQENIRWKLLTRSTRFTCFCTAQTSIFQKLFVKMFRIFWQLLQKFVIFEFVGLIFAQILMKLYQNFADILKIIMLKLSEFQFFNFLLFY